MEKKVSLLLLRPSVHVKAVCRGKKSEMASSSHAPALTHAETVEKEEEGEENFDQSSVQCRGCSRIFARPYTLKRHQLTSQKEECRLTRNSVGEHPASFECRVCVVRFQRKDHFLRHNASKQHLKTVASLSQTTTAAHTPPVTQRGSSLSSLTSEPWVPSPSTSRQKDEKKSIKMVSSAGDDEDQDAKMSQGFQLYESAHRG